MLFSARYEGSSTLAERLVPTATTNWRLITDSRTVPARSCGSGGCSVTPTSTSENLAQTCSSTEKTTAGNSRVCSLKHASMQCIFTRHLDLLRRGHLRVLTSQAMRLTPSASRSSQTRWQATVAAKQLVEQRAQVHTHMHSTAPLSCFQSLRESSFTVAVTEAGDGGDCFSSLTNSHGFCAKIPTNGISLEEIFSSICRTSQSSSRGL